MTKKLKIYFVHDGKAPYPALPAYKAYFQDRYEVGEGTLDRYLGSEDHGSTILWYMMGFYPKKVPALLHVHDYRSLSVGAAAGLKDFVKSKITFKPDVRIFQNEAIRDQMRFRDGIPYIMIPVGISPELKEVSTDNIVKSYDFGYLGMINRDRRLDILCDSFLRRHGGNKTLLLVGPYEESIRERYSRNDNIIFTGKKPQAEAYKLILSCRVAVAYFPYKRPHTFQAPTKLLEYIALGMPLLVNDAPANLAVLKRYEPNAIVRGQDLFSGTPEPGAFEANVPPAENDLHWPNFLIRSGVDQMLSEALEARGRY